MLQLLIPRRGGQRHVPGMLPMFKVPLKSTLVFESFLYMSLSPLLRLIQLYIWGKIQLDGIKYYLILIL